MPAPFDKGANPPMRQQKNEHGEAVLVFYLVLKI